MFRPPPSSTLFPYTPLFRSRPRPPGETANAWRPPRCGGTHTAGGRRAGRCHRREMPVKRARRSEEHTSELQSRQYLVCRLLLEKNTHTHHLVSRVLRTTYYP